MNTNSQTNTEVAIEMKPGVSYTLEGQSLNTTSQKFINLSTAMAFTMTMTVQLTMNISVNARFLENAQISMPINLQAIRDIRDNKFSFITFEQCYRCYAK